MSRHPISILQVCPVLGYPITVLKVCPVSGHPIQVLQVCPVSRHPISVLQVCPVPGFPITVLEVYPVSRHPIQVLQVCLMPRYPSRPEGKPATNLKGFFLFYRTYRRPSESKGENPSQAFFSLVIRIIRSDGHQSFSPSDLILNDHQVGCSIRETHFIKSISHVFFLIYPFAGGADGPRQSGCEASSADVPLVLADVVPVDGSVLSLKIK